MNKYIPIHVHSTHSYLDGANQVKNLVEFCNKHQIDTLGVTDHGNIGVAPMLADEFKKASLKPIFGVELYLCKGLSTDKVQENRKHSHLCVLARSHKGWQNLLKLVSHTNSPDRFYYKPRTSLEEIRDYAEDLVAFSGHPGSDMFNILFESGSNPYDATTLEDAKNCLSPDWRKNAVALADQYKSVFGDLFYLEIQLIDADRIPAAKIAADCLREIGASLNIPRVATADSHYYKREHADDQRVLLACNLKTTLKEIQWKISNEEEFGLSGFFRSNNYHIWEPEEFVSLYLPDEIQNTFEIANSCEKYSILNKPQLPRFCDNPDAKLREVCREGWAKYKDLLKEEKVIYGERVNKELAVISKAGLSDYFLIVWDIVKHVQSQGWLVGKGRGSAAGSLVLNLLGVTDVNPIKYGLIFERFYNEGRNSADNISLPDVDLDFDTKNREKIFQYIRDKFGNENTAQIVTFNRMRGKAAIKDVLRAHDVGDDFERNEITEYVPDESRISDQLQEMVDAGEEPSIIMWSLEHHPKELSRWCSIDDNGKLIGPYAKYFEQAIRLEGTVRGEGKHAAGIVIAPSSIDNFVPMIYDKGSKNFKCGFDKVGVEKCGLLKLDILVTAVLDKINAVAQFLKNGV